MATHDDVRRIARDLPDTAESEDRFGFAVLNKGKWKGFVWTWMERVHPKRARVPNPDVLAVRVASLVDKELLLATDAAKFFTEPHYNGYPAVLVRLPAIEPDELEELVVEAWRCLAPKALVEDFDQREV
jgi:hypothetical protein